jgi:hypothetical protein
MRQTVALSLDAKIIKAVDSERGMVPRSRYIEDLLLRGIEEKKKEVADS